MKNQLLELDLSNFLFLTVSNTFYNHPVAEHRCIFHDPILKGIFSNFFEKNSAKNT